jgi:hypothetical protein
MKGEFHMTLRPLLQSYRESDPEPTQPVFTLSLLLDSDSTSANPPKKWKVKIVCRFIQSGAFFSAR